jgi:hypothetical protein
VDGIRVEVHGFGSGPGHGERVPDPAPNLTLVSGFPSSFPSESGIP